MESKKIYFSADQVPANAPIKKQSRLEMTEKDRVAVYLELIDSYQAMDKQVKFLSFLLKLTYIVK